MAYEDWNEIEGEDQDELQDASVGSQVAPLSRVLIQLSVVRGQTRCDFVLH